MSFDGIPYADGALIYPFSCRPGSNVTGIVLSRTLRSAYYLGRYSNRLLFQQNYAYNARIPASMVTSGKLVSTASSYVKVAESTARISTVATHVRATVKFGVVALADSEVRTRLVVNSGTPGPYVASKVGGQAYDGTFAFAAALSGGDSSDWSPATMDIKSVLDVDVEASLSGVTLPQICRIRIEMQIDAPLNSLGGTDFSTAHFKPLHVSCFWEVRG